MHNLESVLENETHNVLWDFEIQINPPGRGPRGVIVKAVDSGIVVSEFELQSRYYIQFRTKTLGKGMNRLILPAMG